MTSLKGVTSNVWQLNQACSVVQAFRILIRHIKRFNDV